MIIVFEAILYYNSVRSLITQPIFNNHYFTTNSTNVELTQTRLGVTCCDNHVHSMQIKLQNIHFGSISALKGIQDM